MSTEDETLRALRRIGEVLGHDRDGDYQPIEHSLDRLAIAAERIADALERMHPDRGQCRALVDGVRCRLPRFHHPQDHEV